jgi:hypothetical protein
LGGSLNEVNRHAYIAPGLDGSLVFIASCVSETV